MTTETKRTLEDIATRWLGDPDTAYGDALEAIREAYALGLAAGRAEMGEGRIAALDIADQLRRERARPSRDGADVAAKRRLLDRLLVALAGLRSPPPEDTGRTEACKRCNGHGEHGLKSYPEEPTRFVRCEICRGTGKVAPAAEKDGGR